MAWPASSQAVLFQDNFENNTTVSTSAWPAAGDFDPDNAVGGTWASQEAGAEEDIQVSNYAGINTSVFGGSQPTAHSGSNYLISGYHHEYYGSWGHAGLPVANLPADVAQVVVDCWVWGLVGSSGGDDKMYVAAYAGANRAGNGAFLLRVNGSNDLQYVSSGWNSTGLSMVEGVWNHLMVSADMTTHTIGISLNGSLSVGGSFYYQNDVTIGSVAFYSDVTSYYDDIVITPEPCTMVLLGLGALTALRRRA
jgi:hypothetical protein